MTAPCLINVTGTSGEAAVRFKLSSVPHTVTSTIGSFYINSAATDVTYTTISGNAIASSSCLTIDPLPLICYKISWKGLITNDYKFDAILFGTEVLNLDLTSFPKAENFIENVNSKNDSRIHVIQYKIDYGQNPDLNEYSFIVKVFDLNIPVFRIRNKDNSGRIYLHGEVSPCENVGYTNVGMNSNPSNTLN